MRLKTPTPFVSFCISTYKRPGELKETLHSIMNQKYKNFEVIITDNDIKGSGEKIALQFKSKKIRYIKNKKNLGMVESFNKGLSYAKGKFVTFITDDDPLTEDMLERLTDIYNRHPKCVAYFGYCYVKVNSKSVSKSTHFNIGLTSLKSRQSKYNSIQILKPNQFLKGFFKSEILPDFLWSAGLISRDVLNEINGIPSYGSPHFTDFALLIEVATKGKIAVVNKELGISQLHENSYFKNGSLLSQYEMGVIKFNQLASPIAKKFGCIDNYTAFLSKMVFFFLLHNNNLRIKKLSKIKADELYNSYLKLSNELHFLNKRKIEIYLRINFPLPCNFIFNSINLAINYLNK